jgi:putative oxidoreductase
VRFRAASLVCIWCFIYYVSGTQRHTLNEYGGWAVELLGLYLLGAVALFFTGAGKFAVSSSNSWD